MYWDHKNEKRSRLRSDCGITIAMVYRTKRAWAAEGYFNRAPAWHYISTGSRELTIERAEDWARRNGWR